MVQQQTPPQAPVNFRGRFPYDQWMESTGLPVYRGHYVAEPRSLELGDWPERGCSAAFIQLNGMQGVCEARITEIAPGATTEPWKMGAASSASNAQQAARNRFVTDAGASDGCRASIQRARSPAPTTSAGRKGIATSPACTTGAA